MKEASVHRIMPTGNSGCPLVGDSAPIIYADLLIYGVHCGGIAVFDLTKMTGVARRAPLSAATYLQFAASDGRLLALGSQSTTAVATELQLPTLRLIATSRFPANRLIVSGNNTYEFQHSIASPTKSPPVTIYPQSAQLFPRIPLTQSLIQVLTRARRIWKSTGDVYQAIAAVKEAGSLPLPDELRSMPSRVQRGMAWYAGLLLSTYQGKKRGMTLIRDLHAALPADTEISALMHAAMPWQAAMTGDRRSVILALVPQVTNLLTGVLRGAVASAPHYLIAARWCATYRSDDGAVTLLPIKKNVEPRALHDCYSGLPGVAVYDPRTLEIKAYIPVTMSGSEVQQAIGSVAILGHTAYATIVRRYPAANAPTLVAIDLEHDRLVAKSTAGPYSQLRVIADSLVGCTGTNGFYGDRCRRINPSTLQPRNTIAGLTAPNPFMPDGAVNQLMEWHMGRYAHQALAITAKRLLIEQSLNSNTIAIVNGSQGSVTRVSGKFALTSGFGASSPGGRYTYIIDTPSTSSAAGMRLTRIDMRSGIAVDLADGVTNPLSLMRIGPLLAYITGSTLEVRDAETGRFLCAWPLPSGETYRITDTYVDQAAQSFVIMRLPTLVVDTQTSPTSFRFISQSLKFDIPWFVSRSLSCGRRSAAAEDKFNRALSNVFP